MITRLLVNYYLGINVFRDYTNIISILYYLNLSGIVVYINQYNLNLNLLKYLPKNISFYFTIYWDSITYQNILNAMKYMIDADDTSKMTMI